jgi:hypothetical protein
MKDISAALVKAQKEFGPALKTSSNPAFRNSRYADLSACVEAVIDGLNNNGIFLMQTTHLCDDGVIVETLFIHESGEQMSAGKLHVPASKQDAQGYGSALTYARRYALMAACGIAPEDDDGNEASKKPPAEVKPPAPPATPVPPPKAEKPPEPVTPAKPPAKTEGEGGRFSINITAKPNATAQEWIDLASEAIETCMNMATSIEEVSQIWHVNPSLWDKIKKLDFQQYTHLITKLKGKKASFQ